MKELEELREKIEIEMNRRSGKLTKELELIRQGRNIAYGNVLEWIGKIEKEESDVSKQHELLIAFHYHERLQDTDHADLSLNDRIDHFLKSNL